MMSRSAFLRSKLSSSRESRQGKGLASKFISRDKKEAKNEEIQKGLNLNWWVPHPRTGIYYPKGQEWVMNDVPEGAASFEQTHWLRSVEGVDEPFAALSRYERLLCEEQ